MDERTKGFVGRELIFKAIDGFLADPEFLGGYIVIHGERGETLCFEPKREAVEQVRQLIDIRDRPL